MYENKAAVFSQLYCNIGFKRATSCAFLVSLWDLVTRERFVADGDVFWASHAIFLPHEQRTSGIKIV